jgi:lactoylglutathione lyase
MPRIAHLAMKVEDIDKASDFFAQVFGFTRIEVSGVRSTVRYLTDGNVHLAINQARAANPASGKAAENPCIDHFGIEVDDVQRSTAEAGKYGCDVVSEPGKVLKVRDPAGIPLEIIPVGGKPDAA